LEELYKVTTYNNKKTLETFKIPDLSEDDFKTILINRGCWPCLQIFFPKNDLRDFIDEYFKPDILAQAQIQDFVIKKFLKGKLKQIPEDIINRLPAWLVDLKLVFILKRTKKLASYRVWDYKIELLPGKDPLYFCNRPMSLAELKVVRK
jgi:hypothetical protein